jgi:hypothetical protein
MPSRSGAVHVATTTRSYKGKLYCTHLLRRTFRVGSQVKHETLGNISHLPPHLIELIRRSLAGDTFLPAASAFRIERTRPHGHVQATRLLPPPQLDSARFLPLPSATRARHDCQRILQPTRATRLWHLHPCRTTDVANYEDDLYRALDWLLPVNLTSKRNSRTAIRNRHLVATSAAVITKVTIAPCSPRP